MEIAAGSERNSVSIIITSHNYDAFLARAIGSALGQTLPATEVIVIDDGSTDNSAEIIRGFGDRISAVFKAQGGRCSCINLGFRKARGEIIIFLDADDVLLPDAVQLHVAEFATPDTAKSCGYMEVIDENGTSLGQRIPAQLPSSGNYRDLTLREGLDTVQTSFTSGHAWSRPFLDQVLPLPENDLIGIDGYLTSIDRLFGRIAFIHGPVVQYRLHDRNKGPIRYRFDVEYMKNRKARKKYRIEFAEAWIDKLGYTIDKKSFRAMRDWRLLLMQHVLWLNNEAVEKMPVKEFLLTPFRKKQRNLLRSMRIAVALLTVKALPNNSAQALSQHLLEKAKITNRSGQTLEAHST